MTKRQADNPTAQKFYDAGERMQEIGVKLVVFVTIPLVLIAVAPVIFAPLFVLLGVLYLIGRKSSPPTK